MSGTINTQSSGLYTSIEPIVVQNIGMTIALQNMSEMQSTVSVEGSPVDTKSTVHPITHSIPGLPGVVTGTTHMLARAVCNSSEVFSIHNQAVSHSGTKKLQNLGNCPVSPMSMPSSHSIHFYIEK